MASLGSLFPNGDIDPGSWTASTGNLWSCIDEAIASASDTDYIELTIANLNSACVFDLGPMPSDFSTMATLSIAIRIAVIDAGGDDGFRVRAKIWDSGGAFLAGLDSDPNDLQTLCESVTTPGASDLAFGPTSVKNIPAAAFTNLDTTANKTTWDGARLFIDGANIKVKGQDTYQMRIYAVEITGTYTQAAGGIVFLPPVRRGPFRAIMTR